MDIQVLTISQIEGIKLSCSIEFTLQVGNKKTYTLGIIERGLCTRRILWYYWTSNLIGRQSDFDCNMLKHGKLTHRLELCDK